MMSKSLDTELKVLIAVKVSEVNKCDTYYRIHSKKLGKINYDERVNAILKFVEKAALTKGDVKGDTLKELLKCFNEKEIFEIMLVVCLYMFLNTFNNLIELQPEKV